VCVLRVASVRPWMERDEEEDNGLGRSMPPPFIDTGMGGVHIWEISEVIVFPRIVGEQWRVAVESTLQSMASGVDVVLGSPFSHVGIAPASCDSCERHGGCC